MAERMQDQQQCPVTARCVVNKASESSVRTVRPGSPELVLMRRMQHDPFVFCLHACKVTGAQAAVS